MSVLKIKKPDGTWESINNNSPVEIDTTLTQSGKAADAKAVGDKINDLPSIIVQPDEPSTPVDGMLWLDTDAESSNIGGGGGTSATGCIIVQPEEPENITDGMLWLDTDAESSSGGSGGSSNILIGEFVMNSNNVTIIPVDDNMSNLQLDESLIPTLTAIFDACDNYKLPLSVLVISKELSSAYMCNYLSGTSRAMHGCFINSVSSGTMTLYICRDDGLILTNNNIAADILNENFDITVRIYVNSGVAYSLGEGATF